MGITNPGMGVYCKIPNGEEEEVAEEGGTDEMRRPEQKSENEPRERRRVKLEERKAVHAPETEKLVCSIAFQRIAPPFNPILRK